MDKQKFDKQIRGKSINFLIGSGASDPMYKTLSLGKNLPSFEDIVTNQNITETAKNLMYLYYFKNWIYKMLIPEEEFKEETGDVPENYERFIERLFDYLISESNEKPKRINIFTTNYDLMFERTFDKFLFNNPLVYFNDGSRGINKKYINSSNYYLNVTHSGYNDNFRREVPTINLFKLHGSLSWELDKDRIAVLHSNNDNIKLIDEAANNVNCDIKQIKNIINNCFDKSSEIDKFIENFNEEVSKLGVNEGKLQNFYTEYKSLNIINPDKYKFAQTVLEQHYYQLIRSFSYELEKKQAVLIVFGFSFADEHLKEIFERSLSNPELQVYFISHSKGGQEKIKSKFSGYKNITYLPSEFSKTKKGDFNYLISLLGDSDEK